MKLELTNCNYGIVEIPGKGAYINFQDPEVPIMISVPFATPNLSDFIKSIVEHAGMSEEQKRELAPLFNGGIFLPGDGFKEGNQG